MDGMARERVILDDISFSNAGWALGWSLANVNIAAASVNSIE